MESENIKKIARISLFVTVVSFIFVTRFYTLHSELSIIYPVALYFLVIFDFFVYVSVVYPKKKK